MTEKKPFKILSIDGGGIKGLYSASVLAKIEEKAGKKSGECFDMICGTSTGGLIALGLANGQDARFLADLYLNKGNQIFPTFEWKFLRRFNRSVIHTLKQTFLFGKYPNNKLKKIIEDTFGETTLGQLNNLVCIPSFNLISGMPRVFKYPHKEGGFFMDKDIPLVDAALATSAAPTYFPIHEYNDFLYVDGGVWANNPSMCGLLEALKYFVGEDKEYSHVEMLSIASVAKPSGWPAKVRKRRSFIGWKSKLIEPSMDGQAYFAHFFLDTALKRINNNSIYVRVKGPSLSPAQMPIIEMDRADSKALKTLKTLGEQEGYTSSLNSEVLRFYKTNKTYYTD
ncbi:CBASS cGAMP-activated phospholipase [Zobellia uliginosa]|uniref:CBASS cGAMP-activated phospholipase n=1 Tax=Zobellia uliginosa TaxID=143224 RepID=UPI0026E15B7C|nr:CBASS cGAMP-activated phospholipase [Zobellia uliginosa]MDO6516574.1 CBASS cGAMP-activated phospholipase [Zobellia uliginosa]